MEGAPPEAPGAPAVLEEPAVPGLVLAPAVPVFAAPAVDEVWPLLPVDPALPELLSPELPPHAVAAPSPNNTIPKRCFIDPPHECDLNTPLMTC